MALPLINGLEGGTNTTAISNANSGGVSGNAFDSTVGTAPTFSSTHAAHGALALAPATTAQSMVQWVASMGTPTELWARVYLWIGGTTSAAAPFIYTRDQTNATNLASIRLNNASTTPAITANGFTAVTNFTNSVPTSTWVRFELHGLISGGNLTADGMYFASMDALEPTETQTITATTTATSFGAIRFGCNLAQTQQLWLDDMLVNGTGWPGPAAPRANIGRSFIAQGMASTR